MAATTSPKSEKARTRRVGFRETWTCGACGRRFSDCTSCCAHEAQCGGRLSHC